jgi:hypothetical protein
MNKQSAEDVVFYQSYAHVFAVPLGALTCASMLLVIWSSELFERLSAPA